MTQRNGSSRLAIGAAAAFVALGLALTGCTSGPQPSPTPTGTQKTATSATAQKITVIPGTATDGFTGAGRDAKVTTCAATKDGWKSAGTVTNSDPGAADYRIYVSFQGPKDAAGKTTRGVMQVDVNDVAHGKTKDWSQTLDLQGDDLTCVLRVEKVAHK